MIFPIMNCIILSLFAASLVFSSSSQQCYNPTITQQPLLQRGCALAVRIAAARVALNRKTTVHPVNGDEDRYPKTLLASFTKGLPHDPRSGVVVNSSNSDLLIQAAVSGKKEDLEKVPLGPPIGVNFTSLIARKSKAGTQGVLRGFQGCGDGVLYSLEGADPQLFSMVPPPKLDSKELATEMTEL